MNTRKNLSILSPTGRPIQGELVTTQGKASLVAFEGADGKPVIGYEGRVEHFWNSIQAATNKEGEKLYVDTAGEAWPRSALTFQYQLEEA